MYFKVKIRNILHIFIMTNIGKQLSERRKKLGLSQQDLAEISGVSLRTINAIENDASNPSIEVVSKIAEPLGLVISLTERVQHD